MVLRWSPAVDEGQRWGIRPQDGCSAASTAQEAQHVVLEPALVGLGDRMADPVIEPQRGLRDPFGGLTNDRVGVEEGPPREPATY